LLIFIVILIFLIAPFNNEQTYLLRYVFAFASLFVGLLILKKKNLFATKPRTIILTGIILTVFTVAFLYKSYFGITKDASPSTDSWGNVRLGCGSSGSLF